MSTKTVIEHLKKYNMDKRIITVPTTSATVAEAAEALGTEEARIAKTLSFKLKDKYILIVVKGDVKIDNAKYKDTNNEKVKEIANKFYWKFGNKIVDIKEKNLFFIILLPSS